MPLAPLPILPKLETIYESHDDLIQNWRAAVVDLEACRPALQDGAKAGSMLEELGQSVLATIIPNHLEEMV